MSRFKLGLIYQETAGPYLMHYKTAAIPAPATEVAIPNVTWPMALNDTYGDCLGPGTRVLTADLRWVAIETLSVGDELVGFDEMPGDGSPRQLCTTTVERVAHMVKPCHDLELSNGTVIRASFDHQWLRPIGCTAESGGWITTEDLRVYGKRSSSLAQIFGVWDDVTDDEYARGYLAGALDGEGCVAFSADGTLKAVQFTQRDNAMLEQVERFLTAKGFTYTRSHIANSSLSDNGYELIRVGGRPQALRLLGMTRPPRLLGRLTPDQLGTLWKEPIRLVEKKDMGPQEVVAIQTSTRTFIAEGFASHNCTIAGVVHVDQAADALVSETYTYPGDPAVKTTYFGLTGGGDTGLMPSVVLNAWFGKGLFGSKIDGWAKLNVKDTTEVKQATTIFGVVYTCVNLPGTAQQQFREDGSGVWKLTHTAADHDIEGGHCIVIAGYNATGPIAITWGSTVQITWEWWLTYVSQAFAVIAPGFVEAGHDSHGIDVPALVSYLTEWHGTV